MTDQKNTILAIVLSAIVLIGWQFFFAQPQLEKQQQQVAQQQQAQRQAQTPQQAPAPGVTPGQAIGTPGTPPVPGTTTGPAAPGVPGAPASTTMTRGQALAASPRVPIQTPSISGSISLKGGRGPYLVSTDGDEYLDLVSEYCAAMVGHSHPDVVSVTLALQVHPAHADPGLGGEEALVVQRVEIGRAHV